MIKNLIKNNRFIVRAITILLYYYLRFVYLTSRIEFIFLDGGNKEQFISQQGVIFAFWHNRLAMSPVMLGECARIFALISSHRDGRVLNNIVTKFNCGVIEGSTNKNPLRALKSIITKLSEGNNIIITPDGPRGPVYKINSAITDVARKYNHKLIPVSSYVSRYFLLKSWDRLIIPFPFSTITVRVGAPLNLTSDKTQNDLSLEKELMNLSV